ncbi:hypothetical protein [Thermus oshimai]|jgi:hypothetical protein|uniref:hypothetical protein n=1 Tax=Thermus oshimai TaxID=56957 RepID=UPI0003804C8B|nr:hypothetical protein [Thermus oshimai]
MRPLLPLSGALGLFLLLFAAFRFTLGGLLLALLLSAFLFLLLDRWQGGFLRRGPSPWARERLAMKEAWRRGGFLRPEDLSPYMPLSEAQALLQALAGRGICRREGEGYRF